MVRHWIAAILSAFLCALAIAAPETTTITGTIYVGGVAATGGTVSATLSQAGVTPDGSSEVAVTGTTTTALSGAGAFSIALVPNDAIRPSATYYDVRITVTGPTSSSWRERWVVATSPDPTTYGTVTKVEVVPGRIVHADYVRYVPTEPTGTCTANETPRIEMATDKWCECVSGTWSCSSMGGGGSSAFSSVTSGTNTSATMTVGSGATIDVQGGTLRSENLNAVRYMDQLATGGTGADLTNRWTGWWTSLAANTVHRFPKGYYGVNDGASGGSITIPAGATLLCDEGAIFSFSAARTTVANMFFISPGSDNITIKGCAFEPGVTVPFDGYPGGTGGGVYLGIGTLGDVNVSSNIAIEGNRFGVFRYDTSPAQGIGGGVQIRFHEVDNLKIHGNTFDASRDCIDNDSANNTAQHTPSNVSIVGNVFNFSQTWEDMGGAIQLGTGLGKVCAGGTNPGTLCFSDANCTGGGTCTGLAAYETIGSGLVVADNVFENVNGVLYLNHRWDGVTVTGNVARSDNLDFFMLPGVCSPLSGICSAASTAVTVTGNSIVTDIIPGNGVVDHTGPNGIKVAATGAVNISDNIILGAGGIEINGYDTAQVPDWAKGPVIVANNIVNHIDKTTTDATSWCVYSTDLSYVQITGNTCVNTGNYGIRNEANSRTPEFVTVRDNLIIDKNVSSIYGSGVSLGSCTKCVVEGNIFRGPIPSGGVVTGATADDMVYGNTADPALSSVIPFIIGPGTNNDIKLRFDQGSTLASGAADPDLVWDDNPGQFEFDFTGTLNDGDPKIASTGFIGPVTGNASTASALAADPVNCSAGSAAGGVTAAGLAESCIDPIVSTEIDTSAELAGILGDETGSGAAVFADGPTFGNAGATFGSALGETKADVITLPQWGQIRFEVPNLDDATGSTAFRIGSNYVIVGTCSGGANNGLACTVQGECPGGTCVGTHDNALGIYYNASGGMAKINSTEWAFGQFIETNWDQAGDGSDNWLEYNWDFIPKATTNGWRPWYWVLDTNARSGDGAVITWAVNTFRSSANNAILVKYDTATGAYGSTVDFNYSADVTGAGKTRAHYGLFTSEEQADAYAFSAARMDKGTGTTSHARLYGAFQAIVSLNSSTASHDYGYGRANRSEVEIIGSGANQHSESLVAFSGKVTVNPSTGTNVDAVAGLEVEFGTVKDQAGIVDTLWGARLLGLSTNFTNQIQNTNRGGLYVGDQRCRAADTSNCAAIFIETQNNNDGSSGNLAFNGGDFNSGHITFRNGWVHLYNSGDATYSFNSAALRLTRGLNPAALASRSGGLVATSNGNTAASAATITIEDGDHWVQPTGSTNVDTLNTCDTANKGKHVVVICGAYTGTLNDATGNLQLAGNLTCTSNDTLSLVCDGSNWLETSRNVN